jgi:hypothetical protein
LRLTHLANHRASPAPLATTIALAAAKTPIGESNCQISTGIAGKLNCSVIFHVIEGVDTVTELRPYLARINW